MARSPGRPQTKNRTGPDEARQKKNINTIQSQRALRAVRHSVPLGPSDVIKRGNVCLTVTGLTIRHAVCLKIVGSYYSETYYSFEATNKINRIDILYPVRNFLKSNFPKNIMFSRFLE
jgi:hypothetical protein